jgi:endonuclease V-like protein UPF0215 family
MRKLSHVIGFDDAPFVRAHRGDVMVVGTVYSQLRLDGVVSGRVRRDGQNSTRVLAELSRGSRFGEHLQAILMQGIAFAGFNVVDLAELHARTQLPVLVVARKKPNLVSIRAALEHVPGGARKWKLIQKAGAMEPLGSLWIQRAGLTLDEARELLRTTTAQGNLPEPLRIAHLIAGGVTNGASRGGA